MKKQNQRWYVVNKAGNEFMCLHKPDRGDHTWIVPNAAWKLLLQGSIERITGKRMTWSDEPLEWWDGKEREGAPQPAPQQLITDQEIDAVWGYANFGRVDKREIIFDCLKKIAEGWHNGHTITCIVKELGLATEKDRRDVLTEKGVAYLINYSKPQPAPQDMVICTHDWESTSVGYYCKVCDRYFDYEEEPAPQDLRERIGKLFAENATSYMDSMGEYKTAVDAEGFYDAMLQFHSEVSAEKDRDYAAAIGLLSEYREKVKFQNAEILSYKKRIAELETSLAASERLRAKDGLNAARRIAELESELSGIKTQRQHDMLLAKSAVDRIAELDGGIKVTGETSDGYHTFNELYEFRKVYNAVLFNEWASKWHFMQKAIEKGKKAMWDATPKYDVHKSWRHHDGELCFGGGWFIVVAVLPSGQISNHYEAKDWDLFKVPESEKAKYEFDGHTGRDVINRLLAL